jgi:hypothetical protein
MPVVPGGQVVQAVGVQFGHRGGQAHAEGQPGQRHSGDRDGDGLGGDQGAAGGGDEHGRDDGLVPVLPAGGDDAEHDHGQAAHDADLEHLVGDGVGAEGGCAVLAGVGRGDHDADHR